MGFIKAWNQHSTFFLRQHSTHFKRIVSYLNNWGNIGRNGFWNLELGVFSSATNIVWHFLLIWQVQVNAFICSVLWLRYWSCVVSSVDILINSCICSQHECPAPHTLTLTTSHANIVFTLTHCCSAAVLAAEPVTAVWQLLLLWRTVVVCEVGIAGAGECCWLQSVVELECWVVAAASDSTPALPHSLVRSCTMLTLLLHQHSSTPAATGIFSL